MKNLFLFFSIIVFCSSCSKNRTTFEEKVIGDWQINSFVVNACIDTNDNVAMTTSNGDGCVDMWGTMNCMTLSLEANGKAVSRSLFEGQLIPDSELSTYTMDEASGSITLCPELGGECSTFLIEGDDLYNEMDEDGCICVFGFRKMN